MTTEERESERRRFWTYVWIECLGYSIGEDLYLSTIIADRALGIADRALKQFDERFPIPKSR
jgi:hypothetical protein